MMSPPSDSSPSMLRITAILVLALIVHVSSAVAAVALQDPAGPAATDDAAAPAAPEAVDVAPTADDEAIARRLESILDATPQWIRQARVEVNSGIVSLHGRTDDAKYKQWAGDVARRTQDVVAVVNQIEVIEPPLLDFTAAGARARSMWRAFVRSLPVVLTALVLLVLTLVLTRVTSRLGRRLLRGRLDSPLLAQLLANAAGILVFILGLYVVLRVSSLTNLALTVLGGTGLFGLVLGIAFRDIAENYLASLLISVRRPFRPGDTIRVAEQTGIVQMVTTRGTLLITFDGNHVLIPNSTIYKSVVTNLTANPKIRQTFTVGIGYADSVAQAQDVAMEVLRGHEAVLDEPAPMVLVEQLGSSSIMLRVYFWINGRQHDVLKAKSSVIRLTKRAYQQAEISMPDDAREVIFPEGVPVQMVTEQQQARAAAAPRVSRSDAEAESAATVTQAEGELSSEHDQIAEQARVSDLPDQGEDLLRKAGDA